MNALFSQSIDGVEHSLLCPSTDREFIAARPYLSIRKFERNGRGIASIISLLQNLHSAIVETKPDILHAHSTIAGLIVRVYASITRFQGKVIYSPHGWSFQQGPLTLLGRIYSFLEFCLAFSTDKILCISRFEMSLGRSIGINENRMVLVYNGIPSIEDCSSYAWCDSRLKVLFVGRLDFLKGVDTLIDAVKELNDSVVVRLVGGRFLDDFEIGALPENVELVGVIPNGEIDGMMRAADIVAVPSRWEVLGLVAIEGMRAGKPVIASAVGGLREIVVDGLNGFLFSPGSADDLRHAIIRSLHCDLIPMGTAASERFREMFRSSDMIVLMTQLYKSG